MAWQFFPADVWPVLRHYRHNICYKLGKYNTARQQSPVETNNLLQRQQQQKDKEKTLLVITTNTIELQSFCCCCCLFRVVNNDLVSFLAFVTHTKRASQPPLHYIYLSSKIPKSRTKSPSKREIPWPNAGQRKKTRTSLKSTAHTHANTSIHRVPQRE